jgi:hypothetical protein
MQKCLVISFFFGWLFGLAGPRSPVEAASADGPEPDRSVSASKIRQAPLTIAMSVAGRFGKGHSWYLSVNSAGQAELTVDSIPDPTRRQFVVAREQLADLRNLLVDESFFGLDDAYGQDVPDGSTTTIAVSLGDVTKAVKLSI